MNELEIFKKYNFPKVLMDDLEVFLIAKSKYILNKEDDFLKQKYEMVYTDLKERWVIGKISENTFWELVNVLRKGVDR